MGISEMVALGMAGVMMGTVIATVTGILLDRRKPDSGKEEEERIRNLQTRLRRLEAEVEIRRRQRL